jgi:hypothetical protein
MILFRAFMMFYLMISIGTSFEEQLMFVSKENNIFFVFCENSWKELQCEKSLFMSGEKA